jgi:hypothetical protein
VRSRRRDRVAAEELQLPDTGIVRGGARTRDRADSYEIAPALTLHQLDQPPIRTIEADADGVVLDTYRG